MGTPGTSITDTNGKFHGRSNAYAVGPAVFPTLGSANPSLTALSLARRSAQAIVSAATPSATTGFVSLSLAPTDWQMVKLFNSPASMIHYGSVMETFGWYGLYWYIKEQFTNFILSLDWRISRREENSGVYIRIPAPNVPNALQEADAKGHEVQIDQRGFDSVTNTEGHDFHFHRNDGERDGGFEIYMNFKQSGICQTDAPTLGIKCLSFSHETRITSERR